MKFDKKFLRKKYIFFRKNNFLKIKKFNFQLIFNLINKHFGKKKITIAAYYPYNYEVNILKFIEKASSKKYKISLPLIVSPKKICFKLWSFQEPLYLNKYGIFEPKKKNKEVFPDLVLVPLVAFDSKLNRIGYGKGYYDRSLSRLFKSNKKTISLGIAYSFQKYPSIPVDKYDFKLDYIFTERGIITSNY